MQVQIKSIAVSAFSQIKQLFFNFRESKNCKSVSNGKAMHLQKILFNLISLTNLTLFVDQLISGSHCKYALLMHDDDRFGENICLWQLEQASVGKYIVGVLDVRRESGFEWDKQSDALTSFRQYGENVQIMMINDLKSVRGFGDHYVYGHTKDNIFMFKMKSVSEKKVILRQLQRTSHCAMYNCVVVFYQNVEASLTKQFQIFRIDRN